MTNSLMHPISRAVNTLPLQDETGQTQIYVSCTSAKISCHFWQNTISLSEKYQATFIKISCSHWQKYHTTFDKISYHFWQNSKPLLAKYHTTFDKISYYFWQNSKPLLAKYTTFDQISYHFLRGLGGVMGLTLPMARAGRGSRILPTMQRP